MTSFHPLLKEFQNVRLSYKGNGPEHLSHKLSSNRYETRIEMPTDLTPMDEQAKIKIIIRSQLKVTSKLNHVIT